MTSRRDPGVLRRHRRAFTEGAIEHQPFACRSGELAQHTSSVDALQQVLIRHVQRARNGPVALSLGRLAQINLGSPVSASACCIVIAQPRRAISSWCIPTCILAGTATSIIFGFGSLRLYQLRSNGQPFSTPLAYSLYAGHAVRRVHLREPWLIPSRRPLLTRHL